ncbi:MAG: sodium ion-translocating decarboxylase subunit beta [Desulfosporosinus sp.]|jgi:sodium ion-translocating decarboxylase beta subunit
MEIFQGMWNAMAFNDLYWGHFIMWGVAFLFIYLAIKKGFEPLLLLPIAFGILLVNLPSNIMTPGEGLLWRFYHYGEEWAVIPPLIFLGIGAMTDFGPVIANPKTLLLGAGAQGGVYLAFLGALLLGFNINQAAVIGIIGGADGPTTIFLSSILAPEMMGICAVAAYSYMALVPVIQPPVMKLMTTEAQRKIRMKSLRKVSKLEKIFFPIITVIIVILVVPDAAALMGMFCFGNLMRESGVVERLSHTAQNELMNIVTIFLGISVGATMPAELFLTPKVIGVFLMGSVAFAVATACGIALAHLMNLFLKEKINPLIGAAGVSAVPMSARVVHKVGAEADKKNYLLMHAMGPNVAGVIGTAVAAGMFISVLK